MVTPTVRRSFIGFHLSLGVTLFYLSARTVVQAVHSGSGHLDPHLAIIGSVELIGAVLFLVPRLLRVGGALLLFSIGVAFLTHLAAGQFRGDLLVYATGTWFVMAHGAAWNHAAQLAS